MIKKKQNKQKKKSINDYKEEAWKEFSKYIRLRDCLLTTGTKDYGLCFTCGRKKHFKDLQAGHFLDGRWNSILFDEEGVHAQCRQCNLFKNGNKEEYEPKMIELYGKEKVEEMKARKQIVKRFTIEELIKLKEYYREEYKEAYENN